MADLCKFYKKQKYVSYDNGQTWHSLEIYERGELYETNSPSCGSGVFQYRWQLVDGAYICDGKDRYTKLIYQYSQDGVYWYNYFPTMYTKGALVERDSEFCNNAGSGGYIEGETDPISGDVTTCPKGYVWDNESKECICNGHEYGGECVVCVPPYFWNEDFHACTCHGRSVLGKCPSWDPLKTIKCDESKSAITSADTSYYESGWTPQNYTIGDCIQRIDDNAFNGITTLTSVTINSGAVSEIGDRAFANCQSLSALTFPSSLTSIGVAAFMQCGSLTNINFDGSLPSVISNSLFANCIKLENASWLQYNNITAISDYAFYNCYSLSNIPLPQTLTSIGESAFQNCKNVSNITIPSGVTTIGDYSFKGCTSLSSVFINSSGITIGDEAFANCSSLTAVTVNSSAVTMGDSVFDKCDRLLKLTFTSPTPFAISEGFFDNTNECMLFVPCGSLEAYKAAWSAYEDRIYCNDTGVYYRWVDDSGVFCDGNDEYTRQKQQSTLNGITWTDTGVYRPKDLITHYSPTCGYQGEVALTVVNEDGYTRYYEPCE